MLGFQAFLYLDTQKRFWQHGCWWIQYLKNVINLILNDLIFFPLNTSYCTLFITKLHFCVFSRKDNRQDAHRLTEFFYNVLKNQLTWISKRTEHFYSSSMISFKGHVTNIEYRITLFFVVVKIFYGTLLYRASMTNTPLKILTHFNTFKLI